MMDGYYTYVQSKNGRWHRVINSNGVIRSVEQCNLDDAKIAARSAYIPTEGRRCRHCFVD